MFIQTGYIWFGRYKLPRYMVLRSIFLVLRETFCYPTHHRASLKTARSWPKGHLKNEGILRHIKRSWSTFQVIKKVSLGGGFNPSEKY